MPDSSAALWDLSELKDHTCVLYKGDIRFTADKRGVSPLLDWLESGMDFRGFVALDRVVGRAAAFLYCLLQVHSVHAAIMSKPAMQVLLDHGIDVSAELVVDGIVNRQGTGPCPFEEAVLHTDHPLQALAIIQETRKKLLGQTKSKIYKGDAP